MRGNREKFDSDLSPTWTSFNYSIWCVTVHGNDHRSGWLSYWLRLFCKSGVLIWSVNCSACVKNANKVINLSVGESDEHLPQLR